jgi:hypothetical protein
MPVKLWKVSTGPCHVFRHSRAHPQYILGMLSPWHGSWWHDLWEKLRNACWKFDRPQKEAIQWSFFHVNLSNLPQPGLQLSTKSQGKCSTWQSFLLCKERILLLWIKWLMFPLNNWWSSLPLVIRKTTMKHESLGWKSLLTPVSPGVPKTWR